MATIVDVARAANVSTTTVSHVINRTRHVHPETAQAVNDAIEALGYIPNSLARALAGASYRTIGIAISALNNHYFHETLHWLDKECTDNDVMMIYADHHDEAERELHVVQALHQRRVDGILLASAGASEEALAYLKKHRIPTVLIDRLSTQEFDQVGVENTKSTEELTEHLLAHGHTRIAYLVGKPYISTTAERLQGFYAAYEKRGLTVDSSLLFYGESDTQVGRTVTEQILAMNPRPTAILSSNNLMTIGVMQAIRAANISVPEDMALAGFDDFDWADLFEPRLSLIAQPIEKIGVKAVQLLLERIKNPDAPYQTIQIAPEIKIRHSCGCGK